jgi:hypothetical protein
VVKLLAGLCTTPLLRGPQHVAEGREQFGDRSGHRLGRQYRNDMKWLRRIRATTAAKPSMQQFG